jgi:hypothetical protein
VAAVVFALAFGALIERMVVVLGRHFGGPASPRPPDVPVDEVRAADQTG